jgi:Spy/CpxP family protein refolding chaperone
MNKSAALKTLTALVALAVLMLGGNAFAEPQEKRVAGGDTKGCSKPDCRENDGHKWAEKLNLTADQKKKVDAIRSDRKTKIKAAAEQMQQEHQKLRDMLKGDATDAQLREQHGKVTALRTSMGDMFFDSILQVRAILTPEQRKKMEFTQHEGMWHKDGHHSESGAKGKETN